MTDQYRVPWVPINGDADMPPIGERVMMLFTDGSISSVLTKGKEFPKRIRAWISYPVAWAPMPAPYDPDAPEPVDECAALRAALAAEKARAERLADVVIGYRRETHGVAHEDKAEAAAGMGQVLRAEAALLPGDLEEGRE